MPLTEFTYCNSNSMLQNSATKEPKQQQNRKPTKTNIATDAEKNLETMWQQDRQVLFSCIKSKIRRKIFHLNSSILILTS